MQLAGEIQDQGVKKRIRSHPLMANSRCFEPSAYAIRGLEGFERVWIERCQRNLVSPVLRVRGTGDLISHTVRQPAAAGP
jgi:hypothetical protein